MQSVQREEAAARLPRASQLPSAPGLAPVGDGVWPSLEPEYLISSRDNLRGPRTMIKILVLIVSIFMVPIAYYLWMGGWDTILRGSTEIASFDSKSIMPQPMPRRSSDGILPRRSEHIVPPPRPPTEDETSTRQGGDHGTPAKDGREQRNIRGRDRGSLTAGYARRSGFGVEHGRARV